MRALIVLLTLVAAPYVAGVSQGRPESGHRALKSTGAARPSSVRPSAAAADQLLTVARATGYERRDLAALFEVLGNAAGGATSVR